MKAEALILPLVRVPLSSVSSSLSSVSGKKRKRSQLRKYTFVQKQKNSK